MLPLCTSHAVPRPCVTSSLKWCSGAERLEQRAVLQCLYALANGESCFGGWRWRSYEASLEREAPSFSTGNLIVTIHIMCDSCIASNGSDWKPAEHAEWCLIWCVFDVASRCCPSQCLPFASLGTLFYTLSISRYCRHWQIGNGWIVVCQKFKLPLSWFSRWAYFWVWISTY